MKLNMLSAQFASKQKVAVFDGQGESATVGLYLEDVNGEIEELPWPDDWPQWVTSDFLKSQGFRIEVA